MALQSKTLLNDVGSAVLAETVSQLNRASCSTPLALGTYPSADAGTAGGAAAGVVTTGNTEAGSGILFTAHEACLVTSIRMCTIGAALDAGADDTVNSLVILKVPETWVNGAGADSDQLIAAGAAHGNAVGVALGAAPATYSLLFCSDGSPFSAANGCDAGQVFNLSSVVASGALAAGELNGTLIATNHAITNAVSLSSAGFSMDAGDSLMWGLENVTGGALSLMFSVGYRPVKDSLTLDPAFTPAMTNFKVSAR